MSPLKIFALFVLVSVLGTTPGEAVESCPTNTFNCWNAYQNVCWGSGYDSVHYFGNLQSSTSSVTTTQCSGSPGGGGTCTYVDVSINSVCPNDPNRTYHYVTVLCCQTYY